MWLCKTLPGLNLRGHSLWAEHPSFIIDGFLYGLGVLYCAVGERCQLVKYQTFLILLCIWCLTYLWEFIIHSSILWQLDPKLVLFIPLDRSLVLWEWVIIIIERSERWNCILRLVGTFKSLCFHWLELVLPSLSRLSDWCHTSFFWPQLWFERCCIDIGFDLIFNSSLGLNVGCVEAIIKNFKFLLALFLELLLPGHFTWSDNLTLIQLDGGGLFGSGSGVLGESILGYFPFPQHLIGKHLCLLTHQVEFLLIQLIISQIQDYLTL